MLNFRLLGVIYRRKSLFSNKISFKEIMKNNVNNFILRHDVDSPFVYRKSITKKLMNKIFLLKPEIPSGCPPRNPLAATEKVIRSLVLVREINADGDHRQQISK